MYITSRCSSISATVLLLLFVQLYAVKQSVVIKKSKLCGNTACDEPLFKSRVKRVMGVNKDPTFLSLLDDSIVDVIAFKFSDRPDIMEGQLQDGSRGFFYAGAIDMAPYVEFLRSSIESKKEMQVISQDVADVGSKRTIGIIHSEMDLVRDYNTKAEAFAAEMHLPAPELLPIPQLSQTGHGHSHDHGHGHSHDHGHGHSHDHGHSHSHENEKDTNQHVQEKVVEPNHNTNPSSVEQKINLPGDSAETLTPTAELPIHNANILKDDVSDTPLSLQTQDENLLINNALVDVDPLLPEHNLSEVDQIELLLARDLLLLQQEQLRQEHHPLVEGVGHEPVGINSVASDTLVAQQTSEALSNVGGQVLQDLPNEPLQTHTLPPAMPEQPQAVPPAMSEQPQAVPAATSEQPQAVPPATSEQPQAVPPATSEQPQAVTEKPPVMPSTVTEQPQAMPSAVTEQPPVIPSVVTEQPQTLPPVETEQPFNGPSTPSTDALPTEAPNVEAVSETSVRTDSIIPTEELTKQSEEAPQGYCDRDDCKTIKQSEPHDAPSQKPASDQFTAKPFEDALGQYSEILDGRSIPEEPPKMSNRASSSVASFIRSALNMDHLSDASIGLLVNIAFVAGSFFLFIASQFLSGFSDSSKFERREFFNLSTRCRELEMAMKNRDAVIDKLQTLGQQRQVDTQSQEEIMRLRHELNSAQQSLALAQTKEAEFDQQFRAAQDSIAEREREVELLKNEVKEYYAKIESASVGNSEINKELEHLKLELNESKTTALEMQQESYSLKEARRHLQQELKSISLDLQKSKTEAEAMEDKVELLTGDLERSKREILSLEELVQQYENEKNQNEESGGSGSGWSDFGEDFNDNERTPEASQSDSKSVASAEKEAKQLRAQLKRRNEEYEEILSLKPQLEQYKQELERFKSLYENEEREREKKSKILTEGSESRLKAIELENETTKKLMEENEAERKNLLKLLTESLKKSSDNDQIVSTLRKDLSTREKDLRELEFESRNKDEKIREIESSLKRLRNEYAKLEVKSFNETKLLKRQLEEVQAPQSRDAFNANTSLDEKRMGGGALSSMAEPIWDEPTTAAAVDFGRNGKDDFYDGMSLPRKTPTRSRRSDRQPMGENSPSDNERQRKEKKDPHRRRSRSQGRQIYAEPLSMPMPYYSGLSSDSSYVSNMMGMGFHPLSGHHSKSGQLHYASSGGSNGGRSPPLEMLRLSDVPPPGVRKPTAGTRMTPGYK